MEEIRTITFVVNNAKPGAAELAGQLEILAREAGVNTRVSIHYPVENESLEGLDACCVIGGDGTLLGVVPKAVQFGVPILGIRMGNLGFLATFSPQEALDKFVPLLKGGYKIENRNLLQCECPGSKPAVALNDIVIKGEDASRLVSLAVRADGELVSEYFCDGLIFSSPTGSTAYNLSAGGPLVHPKAGVVAMTPICPHTLSNRSVVFPDTTRLEVTWDQSAAHPQVKIDGYLTLRPSGDGKTPIVITPAQKRLSLLQSAGHSHFSVVRNKLNWR